MTTPAKRIAVVGAGISGLRCAQILTDAGCDVHVFERGAAVGGRMRTDHVDGFLLDHGFHVMQTAYPATNGVIDFDSLGARSFEPGALVIDSRTGTPRRYRLADPFRRPLEAPLALFSGFAPLGDYLRMSKLRADCLRGTLGELFAGGDRDTLSALRSRGFSEVMIERFFRPLFSGIFLESDLRTSERIFRFVFRMLSSGDMVLPAAGIQAAPEAMADAVGRERITLNSDVEVLDDTHLRFDGDTRSFDGIVAAFSPSIGRERHVWTLHFDAPTSPIASRHLLLNGDLPTPGQVIAHLAVPSDIQPTYAPEGHSLVTVTVVGDAAEAMGLSTASGIESRVREDLGAWFGAVVSTWCTLAVQHVRWALPEFGADSGVSHEPRQAEGIVACGDQMHHGSVEGALRSAETAAAQVLKRVAGA